MWCCPQQIVLYWSRLWAKSEEASELNLPPLPTSISIRKHLQNGDEVGGGSHLIRVELLVRLPLDVSGRIL